MIENPEDYELARAPVGAGEPHTPPPDVSPSEAIYAFAAWLTCRNEAVTLGSTNDAAVAVELLEEFRRSQGWQAPRDDYAELLHTFPDDQAHFDRQADGAYDDNQEQLREEARTYSSLPKLIVAAMQPGADLFELTGLPHELGDERITFTDLHLLGFIGDALKFRLLTTVDGVPLDDTIDLRWDTLPMNAAMLAGVVPALRTHVLKRAGLLDGAPDKVMLDEQGQPVEA